jgi:hypothetical protein
MQDDEQVQEKGHDEAFATFSGAGNVGRTGKSESAQRIVYH